MVLPRGGGLKYFPTDDQDDEMSTLIDGLDAPSTSRGAAARPSTLPITSASLPSTSAATFTRPSSTSFEEDYTVLQQPSTSRERNHIEQADHESDFDQVAFAVQRQQSANTYYTSSEQEENIKCVVSTVIFIGIIVAVFLFMFLINPQMA